VGQELTPQQGKRVFIKDMLYYLLPPDQQAPRLAPSLGSPKRGIGTKGVANGINGTNGTNGHHLTNGVNGTNGTNGVNGDHHPNGTSGGAKAAPFPYPSEAEPGNPTIVPKDLLDKFHFTFLIRDPHSSVPSYYRCTIPPLEELTGFHEYYPNEAGYDELRRFFDYARQAKLVQCKGAESTDGVENGVNGHPEDVPEVCLIDADDLLDDPEGILRRYCENVGLEFNSDMLNWEDEELQEKAKVVFEKWKGFHEDAIHSTDLKPRKHVSVI
jgi:hypothetical protein